MARLWSGLPSLSWINRSTDKVPVDGLVLSGGGARASFQTGALRYLYDRAGIAPSVMVGTSAGSILTAALSQSLDREGQIEALDRVEELWLGMRHSTDMFTPRPWFQRLQERGSEWLALVQQESQRPPASISLPRMGFSSKRSPSAPEVDEDEQVVDPDELSGAELTLHVALTEPKPTGQALGPQVILPLLSMLPRLRTAGGDLSLILRGADASRSMYHPGRVLTRLLDSEFFSSERTRNSGVTVRVSIVGLESGELRYMTETGEMVDRDNNPIPDSPVADLSLGVLASCSIPGVFAPVRIGDDWYVDGGTREATPAEMAIGPLGVDRCFVVVSAPAENPRADSFDSKSMLHILMRSAEILTDEAERDEVALARSSGALVVEPELLVHDAITVDPGLLRINRDYGWLRAAEAHLGLPRSVTSVHRRVIELRMEALELERQVLADPNVEANLLELARVKFLVRDQLELLDAARVPQDARSWWADWEPHVEDVTLPPTWLTQRH
ncbi:patatin-like phospholipase family protein [Propionibacteriaceae bacterium Y1923]